MFTTLERVKDMGLDYCFVVMSSQFADEFPDVRLLVEQHNCTFLKTSKFLPGMNASENLWPLLAANVLRNTLGPGETELPRLQAAASSTPKHHTVFVFIKHTCPEINILLPETWPLRRKKCLSR